METNHANQKGFTLGELLVVIAIMTILVAVAVGAFTGLIGSGKSESAKFEKESVQQAVESYLAVSGTTAMTARSGAAVISSSDGDAPFSTYLRRLPTNYQYTWTTTGSVTQYGAPATGGGGGASWANAYSANFDGVNEYVKVPTFSLNTTNNSISLWFKVDNHVAAQGIIETAATDVVRETTPYLLLQNNNGTLRCYWSGYTNVDTILVDQWYHVVIARTSTTELVYLNGVEKVNRVIGTSGDNAQFNIGVGYNGYFDGNIEEVSVWNKELSLPEVAELYNSGNPDNLADHSAYSDLVSWWRMGDDDTDPTLSDNKGSNDGTMMNMDSGNIEADTP